MKYYDCVPHAGDENSRKHREKTDEPTPQEEQKKIPTPKDRSKPREVDGWKQTKKRRILRNVGYNFSAVFSGTRPLMNVS